MKQNIGFFKDFWNQHFLTTHSNDCLEQFLVDAYWSLVKRLLDKKDFIICSNKKCGRLAQYYPGKKIL